MYPVSTAYKEAIQQNVRDVRITGSITLKDSSTINITDEDIVQGSLYITEQCVSGEDIEVGNVYASEMGLALSTPLENPYSLDGARILLHFGIDVGGTWEYVPLGYFYVTEIERKTTMVVLKALDGMLLFDVPCGTPGGTSSPKDLVTHVCNIAGVTLANAAEVATFANATTSFDLSDMSKVKTCRDLLMWACQIMGAFARMNRQGQLEVVPIKTKTSVRAINKRERFSTDVSDFAIKITRVSMKIGETEYSRGTAGMEMILEDSPFLIEASGGQINNALDILLNQITGAVYVPFKVDFTGDPALQPGDFITIRDAGILDSEIETYFLADSMPFDIPTDVIVSMVTHSTWRYRGKHNIKAAGKVGFVRGVQNQQTKAALSIAAMARSTQDLALAINQSTQLIKDAIGGHVLIRQNPNETNEILIMDHPDPEQATKIWRWNMGGLGYSDNVTGADNPLREYDIAITMDGAINANFIKTGVLDAGVVTIGTATKFADGYNPSEKGRVFRSQPTPPYTIGDLWTEGASGHLRVCKVAKTTGQSYATSDWELATKYTDDSAFEVFIASKYAEDLADLQNQIDGSITTWFYDYAPTLSNAPAVNWTTDTVKDEHIGDLFYDTNVSSGHGYRFAKVSGAYQWIQISDSDVTAALANAAAAQDTADKKRRVFTAQPYGPYDVGDLWAAGSTGDLKRCKTATSTTNYFNAADWELASKYTDDTLAKTKAKTFYQAGIPTAVSAGDFWIDSDDNNKLYRASVAGANEIKAGEWILVRDSGIEAALAAAAGAQETADGKIMTYYQTTMPATGSLGDLWFDTDDNKKLYRHNGTTFVATDDTRIAQAITAAAGAQATADGKVTTFYQNDPPTAEGIGDLWVDTNDGNKLYRWNGTTWASVRDSGISQAMDAAIAAQGIADGKIETWAYAHEPTNTNFPANQWVTNEERSKHEGDIFFDVSSGYSYEYKELQPYETALGGAKVYYNSTSYRKATGTHRLIRTSPAAQSTWNGDARWPSKAELEGGSWDDVKRALHPYYAYYWTKTEINSSTAYYVYNGGFYSGSKTTSIYQFYCDDAPTGQYLLSGDGGATTYILTSYKYGWVKSSNVSGIQKAQATADGKATTFYQATIPTAEGTGDLWVDTGDGNKLYRWNGSSWIGVQDEAMFKASMGVDSDCVGLWHFDGSLNSHKGMAAIGSGNFSDGCFGQAVLVNEGTTNVILDPSFENADISINWNNANGPNWAYTSKTVRTRDTTYKKYGSASVKCGDGVNSVPFGIAEINQGTSAHPVSAGQKWTLSFSAYVTDAEQIIPLVRFYDASGNNVSGTITPPSSWNYYAFCESLYPTETPVSPQANVWTDYSFSLVVPSGVAFAAISLQYHGQGNTKYAWFDGVQFEQKNHATPFVDGTRQGVLKIPTMGMSASAGCISFRVDNLSVLDLYETLLELPDSSNSTCFILWVSASDQLCLSYKNINGQVLKLDGPSISALTNWDLISLSWDSSRVSLCINDAEVAFTTEHLLPSGFSDYLYIGGDKNGEDSVSSTILIDELRIDKVYRDVATRTGWYKAGVPFYTSEDMKQWPGYMRAETDGLKVYDSSNALRVLVGSWLKDQIRKYGIKIIGGEIYSTSIQSGEEGAADYIRLGAGFTPFQVVKSNKPILELYAFEDAGMLKFSFVNPHDLAGEIYAFDDDLGKGLKIYARGNTSSANRVLMLEGYNTLIYADNEIILRRGNNIITMGAGETVCSKNLVFSNSACGPVIKSPNGTEWRIRVDDNGNLSTF